MLAAQARRDLVDRQADVLVGQGDPVQLGALAAGHDVGHETGQARVQRRPREQVRGDLRGDQQLVDVGAAEMRLVARVVDLGDGPDAAARSA